MGEVYREHDVKLGRAVALKLLPIAFATDAARLARFQRGGAGPDLAQSPEQQSKGYGGVNQIARSVRKRFAFVVSHARTSLTTASAHASQEFSRGFFAGRRAFSSVSPTPTKIRR